jgi:hypothetical protein
MLMGQAGKKQVKVGGTPVPVASFANLLGVLAKSATSEYNAAIPTQGPEVPEYLLDMNGEPVCDIAVPEERATVLRGLFEHQIASDILEEAFGIIEEGEEYGAFGEGYAGVEDDLDDEALADVYDYYAGNKSLD